MSTYNKNLPKVSEISFMDSKRKNKSATIVMPFKGVIPSATPYVGWRQSSYSYSYQVQYKVTARLVPDKQLETGSETSKTDWKYPNSTWSGAVDKCNRYITMDTVNRYYRYLSFAGKSLMTQGSYDKLTITYRVRSFNQKKKQHGSWATRDLTIKCKPDIKVHKIVALADGGIRIFFNTGGWKRGDSTVILKRIEAKMLLENREKIVIRNKRPLDCEVGAIGTEEASGYPYAEFAGSGFSGQFEQNQEVVLNNCVFRTCDGVDVSIDGTYTISPIDADIDEPNVTVERDEDSGHIRAIISKKDTADDWDDVKAWLECTVNGETVRNDFVDYWGSDDTARYFHFDPPLDSEMKLWVGITNNLGGSFWESYSTKTRPNLKPIDSKGRIIVNYTDGTTYQLDNGTFNGKQIAVMNYETEYSIDATRPHETELPFGRQRPIAFLGDGLEKKISIKGNIDGTETGEYQTAAYSSYQDWLNFQDQQGICLVRLPNGRMYTALCTQVTVDQADEFDDSRNVTLSLSEVDL